MKIKTLFLAILILIIPSLSFGADYSSDKKIDELADVSAAITTATLVPLQDMNDTDKIGSAALSDVINLIEGTVLTITENWLNTDNPWADNEVANTLTSSIFAGSGSSTNAIDLATAEVAGVLPAANIHSSIARDTEADTLSNATTTDHSIVRYNGTDNKTIQDSGVIIDDSDNITGVASLTITEGTDPAVELNDSDGADGRISGQANDADDFVMVLEVDDSSGDNTDYIELDGVTERVEFKKVLRAESNVILAYATPQIQFNDTGGADGALSFNANDADDGIMIIAVDDSVGDDQTYIESDGVLERVEIKKPLVVEKVYIIVPETYAYTDTPIDITIMTTFTSSYVNLDGDNDGNDETLHLQDGTVAGQTVTFRAHADIDDTGTDHAIIDAETDSTCTGCPDVGIFTLKTLGDNVTLYWTGATWCYQGDYVQ